MNDLHTKLEQHKQALAFQKQTAPATTGPSAPPSAVECFSVQAPPGFSEHFVDFRFQDGNKVAFPYAELTLINFDAAESKIDLNFRGYWVCVYGSNLDSDLYENLRDCRVRWIAEAPETQSPRSAGDPFVERIEIIPPDDATSLEDEGLEEEAGDEESVA